VKNYTYYFEIKDLLTQFIAAFDDCVIKRYDNNRVSASNIEVRYVLAPKQRVLYDIVNEQNNITLPVVAVNVTSITRDEKRVFNKLDAFYLPKAYENKQGPNFSKIETPTPINIEVSMSIIGKYQSDVDQIISNFAPYNNPYIILSWKLPPDAGLGYDAEIRSKVLWNGSVNFTPPIDLASNQKYRVTADTSFTIQGWLFKQFEQTANIYVVDTDLVAANRSTPLNYNSYYTLSGAAFYETTNIVVSGIPTISNIYAGLSNVGVQTEIVENTAITNSLSNVKFTLYGKFFSSLTNILLSSNNLSLYDNLTSYSTAKQGVISGFPVDYYDVLTDTILTFPLPPTANSGNFTIVTVNGVGWDSSAKEKNIVFTLN